MVDHNCGRPNCDESFPDTFRLEKHLHEDHDPPWESIDNYPRAPAKR